MITLVMHQNILKIAHDPSSWQEFRANVDITHAKADFSSVYAADGPVVAGKASATSTVSIADFKGKLTNDFQQDRLVFRAALSQVSTPQQLSDMTEAFLEGPEMSAAEEFSKLIEAKRKHGHPWFDKMERLQSAVDELRFAMPGFGTQELAAEAGRLIGELEAEIEAVKQQIKEGLEAGFTSGMSGGSNSQADLSR